MDGRGGSKHYGKNDNLTLTDAELFATGKRPQATKGGEALRYPCPVHGSDHQLSLELTVKTGRFFCHNCRCWGYMDWAREEFARENGFDRDDGHRPTEGAPRHRPARRPKRKAPPPPPPVEPVREDLDGLLAGYQEALLGSWGEKYLALRGIPLDLAQEHGVGYASPSAWVGRGWKGGRLVIPHHRPDGTLVNLYGRAVARGKVPKQLKHDHLTGNKGWFNASVLAESGDGPLYVCEAALDALALIASGYTRTLAIYGTYGWRWDWIPKDVRQIVIAADADEGGEKTRETIGVEARLRGIEVAYLTAESYGGEKDAAAAHALGKLKVGGMPAGGMEGSASDGGQAPVLPPTRDYRAEVLAALEAARRKLKRDIALDVPVGDPRDRVLREYSTHPVPVESSVSEEPESEPLPEQVTPAEPSDEAPVLEDPQPEEDNVVNFQEYAASALEKRRAPRDGEE